MLANKGFESNCKRIANEIQSECNNPTFDVVVSMSLIHDFNHEGEEKYIKGINKYLKGCKVKFETLGYGHGWFIRFQVDIC